MRSPWRVQKTAFHSVSARPPAPCSFPPPSLVSLALGTGCNDDIKGPLELNTHKASFSCFVYEDLGFGRFLVFCSVLCSFKRIIKVWGLGWNSVVEHMPRMCEAWVFNP